MRVSTAQIADSAFWDAVDAEVAALDPDGDPAALCVVVDRLATMLSGLPAPPPARRATPVLRSLFRFLDLRDPLLLLKLVRVVLLLTTQGKTVTNACKLLFKLSRDERNDAHFRAERVHELVLGVLRHGDLDTNLEGLVYACGTLKNLASDAKEQPALVAEGAVDVLAGLMRRVAVFVPQPAPPADSSATAAPDQGTYIPHLLAQLTAALRNLASDAHRADFVHAGVLEALRPLLARYGPDHLEVALNAARVLSKLTLHDGCREALCRDPEPVAPLLLGLIVRHRACVPLGVRLLFVLGNLTAADDGQREALATAAGPGFGTLLDLLEHYVAADGAASAGSTTTATAPLAGPTGSENTAEEALVKLVRVLANLAIHPQLGPALAAQPRLELLVSLLETKDVDRALELVLNLVGAVNNVSFYRDVAGGNCVLRHQDRVARALAPLVFHRSMDVVVEAARVFGNFSQDAAVRAILQQHRVDELLVVLLGHDNAEVVFTACGVLMNLMMEPASRAVLQAADGVAGLVDVMARHGGSDWQLAGMAAKTLWNYSGGLAGLAGYATSADECFGADTDALAATLADLLDEGLVDDADRDLWEADFVPAAAALLHAVESHRGNFAGAARMDLEPLPAAEDDDGMDMDPDEQANADGADMMES